jgi:hypothetical protein
MSILVAEGPAAGFDCIGMDQILEERWQSRGIYSARDDGRSLRHVLPFLVVIRTSRLVFRHERDVLVWASSSILPKLMVSTWMLWASMTRDNLVRAKAV